MRKNETWSRNFYFYILEILEENISGILDKLDVKVKSQLVVDWVMK